MAKPQSGEMSEFSTNIASEDSRRAAREIQDSSGLRKDAPVRRSFVRSDDPELLSPMISIYRGGRGGDVAIRLYLALIWRSARPPFDSTEAAASWATLLDLEDPVGNGARRVRAALKKLSQAQLIRIESNPGAVSRIFLCREDGGNRAYVIPSSAFAASRIASQRDVHRYFKVPTKLWTEGHIQVLSGPALVMLLIIMSAQQTSGGNPVWFSVKVFKDRFGIAPATRAAGAKELVQRGLMLETSQTIGGRSGSPGTVFGSPRARRKSYKLIGAARIKPATTVPV